MFDKEELKELSDAAALDGGKHKGSEAAFHHQELGGGDASRSEASG